MKKPVLPLLMAATMATCGPAARETPRNPDPGPAGDQVARDVAAMEGQEIFNSVCSTCHSVDPPASLAPPMRHVSSHYRTELGEDQAAGITRIAEWTRSPAADRSLLPAHAVERWGVMPPVELRPDQRIAVARYVWMLGEAEPAAMAEGRGMMMQHGQDTTSPGHGMMGQHGMGQGRGMMMQHGQDTTSRGHGMMGQRGMGQGRGMMMQHGQDTTSLGHGMMGQRSMGQGRGMMMQHGQGNMDAGPMGRSCPMHADTSETGMGGEMCTMHGDSTSGRTMGVMCPMHADTTGTHQHR